MTVNVKPRRPKPVNFGKKRTLRLGVAEEAAVHQLRAALAKNRNMSVENVEFSEAVRLLLVENIKAAKILAGHPEAWPTSTTVDLPAELWDGLTDCRNRLSHSQGSLYTIVRKLNFNDGPVTTDEVRKAFAAVQDSKEIVDRFEARMVDFVTDMSDVAGAESDGAAS